MPEFKMGTQMMQLGKSLHCFTPSHSSKIAHKDHLKLQQVTKEKLKFGQYLKNLPCQEADTKPIKNFNQELNDIKQTNSPRNLIDIDGDFDSLSDENSNRSESSGDRKEDCVSGNFKYPAPIIEKSKKLSVIKSNTTCLGCDIFIAEHRPVYMREATDVLDLEYDLVQREFDKMTLPKKQAFGEGN